MKHFIKLIFIIFAVNLHANESLSIWHDIDDEIIIRHNENYFKQHGVSIYTRRVFGEHLSQHALNSMALNINPDLVILPVDQLTHLNHIPLSNDLKNKAQQNSLNIVNNSISIGNGNPMVFYYNKSLVDNPPSDFDELLKRYERNVLSYDLESIFFITPLWSAFDVFDENFDFRDNAPHGILSSIEFIKQLLKQDKIASDCLYRSCVFDDFANNVTPFAIAGSWLYPGLKARLGEDLGVAMMPSIKGRKLLSIRFPNVAVMLNQNINPIAIDYLNSLYKTIRSNQPEELKTSIDSSVILQQNNVANCYFILLKEWHSLILSPTSNKSDAILNDLMKYHPEGQCHAQ